MKRRLDWPKVTKEERHRMILEGLADAKAGRVIDDAEVEAWIKGLETDIRLPAPKPREDR